WKMSDTPLKGFLLGLLVAAVIQSSSATSVMAVSFVNAGMMGLAQAVTVILGSNVGTTMTGWILTLSQAGEGNDSVLAQLINTTALYSLLAVVGIVLVLFVKKSAARSVGSILLGLGTLLLAMTLIGQAVAPLKENEAFRGVLVAFENPILGILAGFMVGGVMQSASAGVGILQALCVTGALPYGAAFPLILGINLGASVPVLLSMIGGTRSGKRAALSYLFANALAIPISYLFYLILHLAGAAGFMSASATVMGLAIMNTTLRIAAAVFLLPLHKVILKVVTKIVPVLPSEAEDKEEVDSLADSLLNYPPMALEKALAATDKMAEIAHRNLQNAMKLFEEYDPALFDLVQEKEGLVDTYEDKLGNFIVRIAKNSLTRAQQARVSELLSAIGDLERLSDHANNLAETAQEMWEKKIRFSREAEAEIALLRGAVEEILDLTMTAFLRQDNEKALLVEPLEETIDEMTKRLRANHIERLQKDQCTILTGFVFNDLITNMERVADHCSNLAFSVMHSADLSAEAHVYAGAVVGTDAFREQFDRYREKYLAPLEQTN
ncbi:MAG: Na/Pi cotransporter family protein, partial [Clostridia bacterium]|nr:Na/Pi cotransporter family protein [Clostridia bacterium]